MTTPFNVLNIKLLCPLFCEVIIDHDRSQFRLMVKLWSTKIGAFKKHATHNLHQCEFKLVHEG